ncbi:MAG: hypothetical protein VKL39_24555, partial [Leptolyngbyaceae bacterium]|nr:hypothetical protein [Leptolyngbyaceae bacterium]
VDDAGVVEYLGRKVGSHIQDVISEIYEMIYDADFHPDSKADRAQALIKAVNASLNKGSERKPTGPF